jgi:putative PIN family toxin of toxin-antitoxin system
LKVVVDTNVLISGVFFGGSPGRILATWRDRRITLMISPEIFDEYESAHRRLAKMHPSIDVDPILELIASEAVFVRSPPLPNPVCDDPDDDKFLACALAAGSRIVVSGDRALRRASGFRGIEVLSPRAFVDRFLKE